MPYLTVEEYLARFGNRETIAVTNDQLGGNAVDLPKVEAAILDAGELADGYIAQRYALPILDPPRVLVGMVADLARERLHRTRPTIEVTAAADRARSQLKDIAGGRLTLLLDDATKVEKTADFLSQSSGDIAAETFPRRELDAYMGIGPGRFGESRWKR